MLGPYLHPECLRLKKVSHFGAQYQSVHSLRAFENVPLYSGLLIVENIHLLYLVHKSRYFLISFACFTCLFAQSADFWVEVKMPRKKMV